jgi:hypothetical protein
MYKITTKSPIVFRPARIKVQRCKQPKFERQALLAQNPMLPAVLVNQHLKSENTIRKSFSNSCLFLLVNMITNKSNSFKFFKLPILFGSLVKPQPYEDSYSKLIIFSTLSTDERATLSVRSRVFKFFNSDNSIGTTRLSLHLS